ncbi:MAG: M20/M25/M40 family metallo-hydrolase, partial [Gammaproteobacteria bacterium]|nr:M20/M25/M40 family metallo-hydrolase [Gammaproteobacteria bacterium]
MSPRPETIDLIRRLIAFDTTSRNSNLELIEFVQSRLEELGVGCELVHNAEKSKANLFATLGPDDRGGIALSGHTDVVPVDDQIWGTDPFEVHERDGRLYGRGTADMKSFIAVCLALAPEFLNGSIKIPLHFAFSYDEEVGCLGVRGLLERLSGRELKPKACIIGEPTMMKVVRAHKGKLSYRCEVSGLESH